MHSTILIDPPWPEYGAGKSKRGADRHYPLIKKKGDILRKIMQEGKWDPAEDAHLYLWATNNYLQWGLWLMEALGFTYKTNIAWVKYANGKVQIGMGRYFRGSHELMLFGTRGKFQKPAVALPTVIIAPRTEHSKKPEASFRLIESTSPGPYVEYFSRKHRDGWTSWGNEV